MPEVMRSMLSRAAHVNPASHFGCLVTEHVNGVCIQCEGRPTFRNTKDGRQPSIAFHWFIECKRSSKAAVYAVFAAAPKTGGANG